MLPFGLLLAYGVLSAATFQCCALDAEKTFSSAFDTDDHAVMHQPILFRLGSGAPGWSPMPLDTRAQIITTISHDDEEINRSSHHPSLRGSKTSSIAARAVTLAWLMPFIGVAALLVLMMANLTNNNFNYRVPPYWSPENERQYSFRAYMTDLSMWIMLTDLHPTTMRSHCDAPWWGCQGTGQNHDTPRNGSWRNKKWTTR